MRNVRLFLNILIINFVLTIAAGQEEALAEEKPLEDKKFSMAINPGTLVFPWVETHFGIFMNEHARLNLQPSYYTWFYNDAAFDMHFFGGTTSVSIFIDPYKGWYLEPGLVYLHGIDSDEFVGDESTNILAGQFIGGFENVWKNGFFVNFGGGFGVAHGFGEFFDVTFPYPTMNFFMGFRL